MFHGRLHLRTRMLVIASASALLIACDSSRITGPPRPVQRAAVTRAGTQGLTLPHSDRQFRTQREYLAAFSAKYPPKQKRSRPGEVTAASCDDPMQMSITGSTSTPGAITSSSSDPYQLGAVHVWSTSGTGTTGIPWDIRQLFYPVPGRFLDSNCGQWRFGQLTPNYQYGVVEDGYGTESIDDPPSYPPGDISNEQYNELNPAEKALLWKAFRTMSLADFKTFADAMIEARRKAEEWSANVAPDVGAVDGLQDALRHAYWNCMMVKLVGYSAAVEWGNAHEKYSMDRDAARMDLQNNAAGRKVGWSYASCDEGVRAALGAKLLQTEKIPPPTNASPQTPQPTPPPLDM